MFSKTRIVSLFLCIISLCGCYSYNPNGYTNYRSYTWNGEPLYPESYDASYTYQDHQQEKREVVVPETYHVGAYHSPARAKDRDRTWVDSQNPGGYTIELAEGEKASQVAGKLYKAPKKDRTAQIKYQRNGKAYYKGLYGSYPSYEAAQEALRSLPENVKQGAHIQSWGSVQRSQ